MPAGRSSAGGWAACVDTRNAVDEFATPADVEGGARGGRHAHVVDALNLARCDSVGVNGEQWRRPTIGVDQLGGQPGPIHFAPSIAAADSPATVPRHRARNHAATAR